jgi:hypothetical protein
VHFGGDPGWFQLDCSIRIAANLGAQIDAQAESNMEHEAAQALRRIIKRHLN